MYGETGFGTTWVKPRSSLIIYHLTIQKIEIGIIEKDKISHIKQ